MAGGDPNRRDFLKTLGLGAAAAAIPGEGTAAGLTAVGDGALIAVDPAPKFDLSPWLYMQFMEPLGVTDSSVDAAWDFATHRWREDVVEITQELAPALMRWGGCFCSYYRWREAVGPMKNRVPMLNRLWGGIYNNQVGTHEFLDFCRRVGADPLMVVNFESDFKPYFRDSPWGDSRKANAAEARDWVDYCNNPDNAERIGHGHRDPYNVNLWQIGNETSYGAPVDADTAAKKMVEFATAMRSSDPSIRLIGWGEGDWAPRVAEIAGEHLQYIAFHNGFHAGGGDSPLRGIEYRKDPDRTWEALMQACKAQERKIDGMRKQLDGYDIPVAMTECHYVLPGRNRNEVLSTWAAGAAYARCLNVHERNGDFLKIATLADFCGTRWMNNAVMIPVPRGRSFLLPVAMCMSLYRKHTGTSGVETTRAPDGLDVAASRTGDRVFLHVVNTNRTRAVASGFDLAGRKVAGGKVFWFDHDPEHEVFAYHPETVFPKEAALPANGSWTFPAASVSAVELDLEPV